MKWWQQRMTALDLETTGPDPTTARIVTAAVVHVGGAAATMKHDWLVNPGVPIPAEATAIHGVTNDRAGESGCNPTDALVEILEIIGGQSATSAEPLVIFNASYDLTVLREECKRLGIQPKSYLYVVDPFVIDKQIDKYRKGSRKLDALCAHYRAELGTAHEAGSDALAAARLAYRMGQTSSIGELTLGALHDAQVEWAREQRMSLQKYFRREGKPDIVDLGWPVQTNT